MTDKQWEPRDDQPAPQGGELPSLGEAGAAGETRPAASEPPDPALRDWLLDTLRPSQRPSAPPPDATAEDEALRNGDIASLSAALAGASANDEPVANDDGACLDEPPGEDHVELPSDHPEIAAADEASLTEPLDSDDTDLPSHHAETAVADQAPLHEPLDADDVDLPNDHGETLAPQILLPDGDDPTDEDLAVIGLGRARSKRSARSRRALLGAAAVVLAAAAATYLIRSRSPEPPELAATPPPDIATVDLLAGPRATPPRAKTDPEKAAQPSTKARARGPKAPPDPEPLDVPDEQPVRNKGPSVGRLPDLPPAQLDRLLRESGKAR